MIARISTVAVALVATIGMTATSSTAATPKAQLKKAVTAYSNAYLGGDGARAYALLSKKCKGKIDEPTLDQYADAAKELYGHLKIKTFKAKIHGTSAKATYTYVVHTLDQTNQSWVKQGGHWRYNAC